MAAAHVCPGDAVVLPLPPALVVLAYLAAALVGLGAGVGVNALADRVEGDEEPPWRSGDCVVCRKPLPARRLVPLVGVLALGRRCPACGAALGWRRPLVDGALALVVPLLLAHAYMPSAPGAATHLTPALIFALDTSAAAVLALIFVVDLEHHLVLDLTVYPLAVVFIGAALLLDRKALAAMGLAAVISGGLFLLFFAAGYLIYHQEALGFGDVKLAALIGLVVGWPGVLGALGVCAAVGAASTMILLGLGRVNAKSFIPFGTFLSVGAVVALLLAPPLW
jgi:leader peptidase (prepilin peptidase)/N-methyltransferase